ncbi:MAG: sigma-70 family RNA polymerase sigma factor [Pseudomonadota bacterium]
MTTQTQSNDFQAAAPEPNGSLMRAIENGDKSAFEALYDMTVSRLYGLALRITGTPDVAEEVVADVYLQAWQQADRYAPERGSVMAWLAIICRSRAIDTLRRQRSAPTEQEQFSLHATNGEAETGQELLQTLQQNSLLYQALASLDGHQRQLIALAYFRGYTHSELAKFTAYPIGTIRTQPRRTIITLKQRLAPPTGTSTAT